MEKNIEQLKKEVARIESFIESLKGIGAKVPKMVEKVNDLNRLIEQRMHQTLSRQASLPNMYNIKVYTNTAA